VVALPILEVVAGLVGFRLGRWRTLSVILALGIGFAGLVMLVGSFIDAPVPIAIGTSVGVVGISIVARRLAPPRHP
jgi:drug/metabolite transporter (DMT)-like permease